jgi:hypothetical protein
MRAVPAITLALCALASSAGCGPSSPADRALVRGVARDAGRNTASIPPGSETDASPPGSTTPPLAPPPAPPAVPPDGGSPPLGPMPVDAAAGPDTRPPPDAAPPPPDAAPPPPDTAPPAPDTAPPPGGSLPLVVTDHFTAQGWFGDATLGAAFAPGSTVIRQVPAQEGPCAERPPGARGSCLEVSYTPPAGIAPPPEGGWVGVYFLPPLAMDHPEAAPPLRVGEANWGIEPGLLVAAGARRLSFYAAAATPALDVTFRVGSEQDMFLLPEQTETLGARWERHALPLAGASYTRVIGGFAWLLKDTTRPARFYLDDIVWER